MLESSCREGMRSSVADTTRLCTCQTLCSLDDSYCTYNVDFRSKYEKEYNQWRAQEEEGRIQAEEEEKKRQVSVISSICTKTREKEGLQCRNAKKKCG